MKNYYAFSYNYGKSVYVEGAPHGDGGRLFVFSSKKARDEWVADGMTDYLGSSGYRDSYPESRVRPHVRTGAYEESFMTTRELVEQGCSIGLCSDYR